MPGNEDQLLDAPFRDAGERAAPSSRRARATWRQVTLGVLFAGLAACGSPTPNVGTGTTAGPRGVVKPTCDVIDITPLAPFGPFQPIQDQGGSSLTCDLKPQDPAGWKFSFGLRDPDYEDAQQMFAGGTAEDGRWPASHVTPVVGPWERAAAYVDQGGAGTPGPYMLFAQYEQTVLLIQPSNIFELGPSGLPRAVRLTAANTLRRLHSDLPAYDGGPAETADPSMSAPRPSAESCEAGVRDEFGKFLKESDKVLYCTEPWAAFVSDGQTVVANLQSVWLVYESAPADQICRTKFLDQGGPPELSRYFKDC